ncbi:MAG TPA: hypothetical protein VH277_01615 [Gemmatimonadaceae bacterium]|nr:hypothetical protein [Gemmatimonadaceae bacterium]
MLVRRVAACAILSALAVPPLRGQVITQSDVQNAAAYAALLLTPPAAVAPVATSTILDEPQHGVVFAIRYGFVPTNGASGFNNLAATAVLPMGTGATVSLTGGTTIPNCGVNVAGCSAGLMLGAGGDMRIAALGTAPATRIIVSVNGELGYGKPRDVDHLYSGSVGLPISLIFNGDPSQGMRIVPFVTPAFGFGQEQVNSATSSESGQRFIIGGGVALTNATSSIGASLGFQHVVIDNGKTQVGVSITLGGR